MKSDLTGPDLILTAGVVSAVLLGAAAVNPLLQDHLAALGIAGVLGATIASLLPITDGRSPVAPAPIPVPPRLAGLPAGRSLVVRTAISISKPGAAESENEDALAYSPDGRSLAVADGASSAYASGVWARALVDEFVSMVSSGEGVDLANCASSAAGRWNESTAGGGNWWDAAGRERGSFAAFLGLVVEGDSWRAVAVGDCTLIVADGVDGLLTSFPASSPADFSATPALIATADPLAAEWCAAQGTLTDGQAAILATDAVAHWILDDPWPRCRSVLSQPNEVLRGYLVAEREAGRIETDDLTLLIVHPASST